MMMTAVGPTIMRSSHLNQPGEGAPLLREGPRQLVVVEVPALRQSGGREGGNGAAAEGSRISTARLSSVRPEIHTEKPTQPVVG